MSNSYTGLGSVAKFETIFGDTWTNPWPLSYQGECPSGMTLDDLIKDPATHAGRNIVSNLTVDYLQNNFKHLEIPCLMQMTSTAMTLPTAGTYFSGKPLFIGGSDQWQPFAERFVSWEGKKTMEAKCSSPSATWNKTYLVNDFFTERDFFLAEIYLSPLTEIPLAESEPPLQDRGTPPRDYFVVDYRNDVREWCPNSSPALDDLAIAKTAPFNTIVDAIRPLYGSSVGTVYLGRTLMMDDISDSYFTIAYFLLTTNERSPEFTPDHIINQGFKYEIKGFKDAIRALNGGNLLAPIEFLAGNRETLLSFNKALVKDAFHAILTPKWAPEFTAVNVPEFAMATVNKVINTASRFGKNGIEWIGGLSSLATAPSLTLDE